MTQAMVTPGSGAPDARQGMLAYTGAADGKSGVLSVDLSNYVWGNLLNSGGVSPKEGAQFRTAFYADAAGSAFTDALKALGYKSASDLAQKVFGAKDDSVIDRFDIAVGNSGGTFAIAPRNYPVDPTATAASQQHVDLFVGTTGNDNSVGKRCAA